MPLRFASEKNVAATLHVALQKVQAVLEFDEPLAVRGDERIGCGSNDFPAELEGVLAAQNRDVLQNLQAAIGPDVLGPISPKAESATARKDLDERETEKPRIGHARVDAVGERIHVSVVGIIVLAEVGVAYPEFIHQRRIRGPGPAR